MRFLQSLMSRSTWGHSLVVRHRPNPPQPHGELRSARRSPGRPRIILRRTDHALAEVSDQPLRGRICVRLQDPRVAFEMLEHAVSALPSSSSGCTGTDGRSRTIIESSCGMLFASVMSATMTTLRWSARRRNGHAADDEQARAGNPRPPTAWRLPTEYDDGVVSELDCPGARRAVDAQ
jgi:hypothetical protein